jgi:hypothetical protein
VSFDICATVFLRAAGCWAFLMLCLAAFVCMLVVTPHFS